MTIDEIADALGSADTLESAQLLADEIRAANQDYLAGAARDRADLESRLNEQTEKVTGLQAELYRLTVAGNKTPEQPATPTQNPSDVLRDMALRMKR